jgi:electron transport complex protein RnfD
MKLNTSAAPHLRTKNSTKKVMIDVLIALIPAAIFAVWAFGLKALYIILLSTISAELLEFVTMRFLRKRKDFTPDFSASVTGLLLGLNLSLAVTWYHVLIGVLVAIILGKHVFGGLGQNIFNPALVGRVFLVVSFPIAMTTWDIPFNNTELITSATPLGLLASSGPAEALQNYSYMDMFLGKIPGSIGEISALALIIGFVYLVIRKRIKLMVPITYISSVFIMTGILWLINPDSYATPLFHLLAGGLLLGAFFMATDMVTSPMTMKGQFVFGLGIGLLTVIIRVFGAFPGGVSFAILIMNAFVPLIDLWTKPRIYGTKLKGDIK